MMRQGNAPIGRHLGATGMARDYRKSQEGEPEDPVAQERIEWVRDSVKSSDVSYVAA